MQASLETGRLRLVPWTDRHRQGFAALNADPIVMRYFPATRSRAESDNLLDRLQAHLDTHGFGFWALERKDDDAFIGFTGLQHVDFDAGFTPAVEVGWRLARRDWGKGYATEAGRASLAFGFETLRLTRIVSFAVTANARSRAVMERLGMGHRAEHDFFHTRLPADSPLAHHAFHEITAEDWRSASRERGK